MPVPNYTITHWSPNNEHLTHQTRPLDLQILHTPGHTPDQLAVWDKHERWLFVGDTLYERAPIIFPKEGDIIQYMSTLEKLLTFLTTENKESETKAKIACGHETDAADGEEIVSAVMERMWEILDGNAILEDSFEERGETYDRWGFARFSVLTPRRLVEDARRYFKRGVTNDT
jgi:glyoxylase-like metal-dependent hydrolase (beta-lactamase superfamily II)